MPEQVITIIGGGLAGAEAAWQAAQRGARVRLFEMRPRRQTPAHQTGLLAELVCSNSLKSNSLTTSSGLLKEEMRRLDSLMIHCASQSAVPAGDALAVDRERFGALVTEALEAHPGVDIRREEAAAIPGEGIAVIATGPLTSESLAVSIQAFTGQKMLYFYDAVAPVVDAETIDRGQVYEASRYDKGEPAYLNCPMSEEEYRRFWEALVAAEKAPLNDFEEMHIFEACMPVEEIAARGPDTLAFGPLRPVGLIDPRTGRRPFAVVQLRQENLEGSLYGLVGFQTRLKWGEQRRVFAMIPGLENAEFVRYGVMHRNTFIDSPSVLLPTLQTRARPTLFFAGQLIGVEGYMESAAAGLLAGLGAARLLEGKDPLAMPEDTMMGALFSHVSSKPFHNFQPMNSNFALLTNEGLASRKRQDRKAEKAERAMEALERWKQGSVD
ncbi:MAG: methylenetetrahydrofolate--tRNA-(uracil(54)-C(5))-methyltransferase (FADH(2)-oxidizing) TrmFO [Armatimonadetes bacterium]|nr:methylenetetrahydrofolate--tRNA-(uracil(54)-C(5))-methyltransferase (FADH(2)-oxidizing) TrmFO [Armatimonadota bacterium]